jgi:hypothetical protein
VAEEHPRFEVFTLFTLGVWIAHVAVGGPIVVTQEHIWIFTFAWLIIMVFTLDPPMDDPFS